MASARNGRQLMPDSVSVPAGRGAHLWVAVAHRHTKLIQELTGRGRRLAGLLFPLALLLLTRPAHSQGNDSGVYWHIDPHVKTCSMVIDPSLTQAQWQTFVRQTGAIVGFQSLASAEPLGKRHFNLGVVYSVTPVDQHDPAWINTFTHPDASCPLGDEIVLPALRATLGVSSRMDVSGFWTTAPRANYGLAGGAVKYTMLMESARVPAAAVSASFTSLTGVSDFDLEIYSLGVVTSKRLAWVTPYLGVKKTVAVGTETTPKVDLAQEIVPLTDGFIGATTSIWKLRLAAEYDVAPVNTFALSVGFHP